MTAVHQLIPVGPTARDCTFNLFRNRLRPKIICAVPEHSPIPSFINPDDWGFDQVLRPADMAPVGFCSRAAQAGARFNSYYLFQTTGLLAALALPETTAVGSEPCPEEP
jgi:hypothetical protein